MSDDKHDDREVTPWEMKNPPRLPEDPEQIETVPREISRQCFRHPVSGEDSIEVEISGRIFQVLDIGSKGIGIALERPEELHEDDKVTMNLRLGSDTVSLQGKVIHISRDDAGVVHCGIQFVELQPAVEKQLQDFLQQLHTKLFGHSPGFL